MYSPNETKNHPPLNKRDNNGVERTSKTTVTLVPRLVYSDLNQSGLSQRLRMPACTFTSTTAPCKDCDSIQGPQWFLKNILAVLSLQCLIYSLQHEAYSHRKSTLCLHQRQLSGLDQRKILGKNIPGSFKAWKISGRGTLSSFAATSKCA